MAQSGAFLNRTLVALSLTLAAQPALHSQTVARDSALLTLLSTASTQNRLPRDLLSYSANVETEVAVVLRREEGTETVVALEQIAGTARWTHAGTFEQHLTGHRAQQLNVSVSALTFLNEAWLSPHVVWQPLAYACEQPTQPESSPGPPLASENRTRFRSFIRWQLIAIDIMRIPAVIHWLRCRRARVAFPLFACTSNRGPICRTRSRCLSETWTSTPRAVLSCAFVDTSYVRVISKLASSV